MSMLALGLLFGAVTLLIMFSGAPIAFALGSVGVIFMYGFMPESALDTVAQNVYEEMASITLLSIPLFILKGAAIGKSRAGQDLYAALHVWMNKLPGGLGIANVFACALFAAMAGSSPATCSAIGSSGIPEMRKRGYSPGFAAGIIAAGGTLGILLPPSITMILYAVAAEQSLGRLFLAGVGPGLLLLVAFITYSSLYCHFGKGYTPLPRQNWHERGVATLRAMPTLIIAFVIIAGIYVGVFTPTEAAAIGFFCALVLTGVVLRTLSLEKLRLAISDTMRTSVTILLIVVGAKIFGHAVTLYRIPQEVTAFVTTHFHQPLYFLVAITCVLLVVGLFLESLSMLLIMVPVLYPSLEALGMDPVWFGIYFVILIEVALITPPVGMNLFVIQAVTKARITEVVRGVVPFVLIMLATAFLLYAFPSIALWLPQLL